MGFVLCSSIERATEIAGRGCLQVVGFCTPTGFMSATFTASFLITRCAGEEIVGIANGVCAVEDYQRALIPAMKTLDHRHRLFDFR